MSAGVAGYCRTNSLNHVGTRIELDIEMHPETKMITKMNYSVHFPVDFPVEHKQPIIEKMGNCYVKRHLYTPPTVTVSLAE